MKKVSKVFFTAVFIAALWVQAFHRHHVHEAGVFEPHIDCVVCAWAQGSHVSYLSAADNSVKSGVAALCLSQGSDRLFPHTLLSASLSRAPPLA